MYESYEIVWKRLYSVVNCSLWVCSVGCYSPDLLYHTCPLGVPGEFPVTWLIILLHTLLCLFWTLLSVLFNTSALLVMCFPLLTYPLSSDQWTDFSAVYYLHQTLQTTDASTECITGMFEWKMLELLNFSLWSCAHILSPKIADQHK